MVTATLRDFPQEMNQKGKERIEREKKKGIEGCKKGKKGVWVFNIFFWGALPG